MSLSGKSRPRVGLITVGCKLNQFETQSIREELERRGYEAVPFDSEADLYVVNSCTVTARSDYRSRQMVRRAIRRSPDARVIVTGCASQVESRQFAAIPGVDLVTGNTEKGRIADLSSDLLASPKTKESRVEVGDIATVERCDGAGIVRYAGHTRVFLKVQDGCSHGCSYCLVPLARGRSRSRPLGHVVEMAGRCAAEGYKEIVLTGIDLGAYGLDLSPASDLVTLLEALGCVPGVERIRLSSIEPTEFVEKILEAVALSDKVCRHFHVPLQSGDDGMLRAMGRRYSASEFARVLGRLVEIAPGCGLGTDVIVGFPGETEEAFANTVAMVRDLPFTYLHVFNYSRRPGTEAASLPGQVPPEVRKGRSRELRETGRQKSVEYRQNLIGQNLSVLFEHRLRDGYLRGISDTYVKILIPARRELAGEIGQARVTEVDGDLTYGEAVEEGLTDSSRE